MEWSTYVFTSEFVVIMTVVGFAVLILLRLFQSFADDFSFKREIKREEKKKNDGTLTYEPSLEDRKTEAKKSRKKRKNAARKENSDGDGWTVVDDADIVAPKISGRETVIVSTSFGPVSVTILGPRKKRGAMVTVHDLGTNHRSCFNQFFQLASSQTWMNHFCVYHIDIPGQEDGTEEEVSPDRLTMDNLAAQVLEVMTHFKLEYIVGFGVGLGANVLLRAAMERPQDVHGLILLAVDHMGAGLKEKSNLRLIKRQLGGEETPEGVGTAFAGLYFSDRVPPKVAASFKDAVGDIHPGNLSALIESYLARDSLGPRHLRPVEHMRIMLLTGDGVQGAFSLVPTPDLPNTALDLRNLLNVTSCDLIKLEEVGHLITVERPRMLMQPVHMFLDTLGYIPMEEQGIGSNN